MLATFEEALTVTSTWDNADFASFGISLKASALTQTAYIGPVARLVGWYTSSDHAGYTCSACKTVHGSRVSLARLWHRCPTCLKVYCPSCASGKALYAAVGLGLLAGVTGVLWWAGSAMYTAAFGWAGATGGGNLGSKFLGRRCCEGAATEALT